jgi:hypothetical protein
MIFNNILENILPHLFGADNIPLGIRCWQLNILVFMGKSNGKIHAESKKSYKPQIFIYTYIYIHIYIIMYIYISIYRWWIFHCHV